MKRLAILDRDGTIIWEPEKPVDVDPRETYPLKSPDQVAFLEGAIAGMRKLVDKGYMLVLATNQTFLGTDKHPQNVFDAVMARMLSELESKGIHFDFLMICPHGPDEGCECRKPAIGGLRELLEGNRGNIDLSDSLMFGDRITDEEFARNLSIRFVKIKTNGEFRVPDDV